MLLAFFFLIFVVYITYRFFLTSTSTPKAVNRLLPAFIVFGLLFMLVALFSLSEWKTALSPRNLSPISTLTELQTIETPTKDEKSIRVLLLGNAPEDITTSTIERFTLTDGAVEITRAKNFVFITPTSSNSAVLLGRITQDGLEAEVVFVGNIDQYFSFLDRYAIIPILTVILSVIGGFITWIIPLQYLWQLNKRTQSV